MLLTELNYYFEQLEDVYTLMYWVFLVTFVVIVLIPEFITGGLFSISEDRLESLAIFSLGVIGFIIHLLMEKKVQFYRGKSIRTGKNFKKASDELVTTYGYIGELNRKMEILRGLARAVPEKSAVTKKEAEDIYLEILGYIKMVLRCEKTILRLVDVEKGKTIFELRKDGSDLKADNNLLKSLGDKTFYQGDVFTAVASSQKIDSVKSYAIACPENGEDIKERPDDIEIVKTLLTQFLLLYFFCSKNLIQE